MIPPLLGMFPGQGSQHVGMVKELYEAFSIVRETFEEASDAIAFPLAKMCFEGPESDLKLTFNTQPCLLVSSIACVRVFKKEYDFPLKMVAGHSAGEYAALVCAESLSLKTAMQWVKERGKAMHEASSSLKGEGPPMVALLGLPDDVVQSLCQEAARLHPGVAVPVNFNAPGQVVVAGNPLTLQKVMQLLKEDLRWKGGRAIPLEVSGAFHSPLMAPAKKTLQQVLESSTEKPQNPKIPYIPNYTARPSFSGDSVIPFLIEQMDHPVLWKQSMEALLSSGDSYQAIEFGPGRVLCGLLKRISQQSGFPCEATPLNDLSSLKNLEAFLSQALPPSVLIKDQKGPLSL